MRAAFSKEFTSKFFQVAYQVTTLHEASNSSGSRMTFSSDGFFRKSAIGSQYESNCFLQICASLSQRTPLRICAGQFLDKSDISPSHFLKYCS